MPEDNIQNLKKEAQQESPEEVVSMNLIEFISSEKTSSQIADICFKNGVEDEKKIEEVSHRIALVILGALPKESLVITLESGVGLDAQTAEKISAETDKLIFSQIPQAQPQPQPPAEAEKPTKEPPEEPEPPKPPKTSGKDTYRETFK